MVPFVVLVFTKLFFRLTVSLAPADPVALHVLCFLALAGAIVKSGTLTSLLFKPVPCHLCLTHCQNPPFCLNSSYSYGVQALVGR